jgi:hypothetical protein
MHGMRDLGSFGDERLKKGGPTFLLRWLISAPPVFGGSVVGEKARYGLAVSCIILRSRRGR